MRSNLDSTEGLFYFEAADALPAQNSDVREVHNYVVALEHGLKRSRTTAGLAETPARDA
jgi:hypothetical protein